LCAPWSAKLLINYVEEGRVDVTGKGWYVDVQLLCEDFEM
jgi:hypothetical protein